MRVAPLLYWLTVVCGLTGITVVRSDEPKILLPLWAGSFLGIALGQIVARLRLRAWFPIVVLLGTIWFVAPAAWFLVADVFGSSAEQFFLACIPAAICGYLSLSERGALVSFWYPAMLWMLVILDDPASLSMKSSLPFAVGLAVLFVAFLRARETRRARLWREHATVKLSKPMPRSVLRTSPFRSFAGMVWAGAVGMSGLTLALWIAPHLWQREQDHHKRVVEQAAATQQRTTTEDDWQSKPCCQALNNGAERPKEYLPLRSDRSSPETTCRYCAPDYPEPTTAAWEYRGLPGAGLGGAVGKDDSYNAYNYTGNSGSGSTSYSPPDYTSLPPSHYSSPSYSYSPPAAVTTSAAPPVVTPPKYEHAPIPPPAPPAATEKAKTSSGVVTTTAKPVPVPVVIVGVSRSEETPAPWESALMFALTLGGLLFVGRAVRRQLVLRHLANPFWHESADQRVSNYWQRLLIGLRDAGIHPRREEQPQTFAKRVGIAGMTECATILERARHGVRLENNDLHAMASASNAVYDTARSRAGFVGRVVSWIRWPLV